MFKKLSIGVSLALICAGIVLAILFSPAASQSRAEASLATFSKTMCITQKGSCVADSDGDDYASCTLMDMTPLQCTSTITSMIPFIGSQSCKSNTVLQLKQ